MDDNKRLDETSMTHTHKVTMPQALAIDAMQDVLDLANTTLTDKKYIIATRMSLDALKEVPQLRAQLAAVMAERDAMTEELNQVKHALAMMWFAYVNKDDEVPHEYETEAADFAERILGPWAKCMPKYLRSSPQGAGEDENEQAEV